MVKRIFNQLFVLIGILFLVGIYRYIDQTADFHIRGMIDKVGVFSILTASFFYFLSHFVRGLRMTVMVAREDISLRSIISTQFYTNGINLIFPFKLGEVYRLYEFNKLIKKYKISVSAIVAEKFIDFCFLAIGLIVAFYLVGSKAFNLNYTIILSSLAVLLMVLICFILPQNIEAFNLFIAKRYSFPSILKVLAFTSKLNDVIKNVRGLFKEKMATLFIFTAVIWVFEILAFFFLFKNFISVELILLLSFLVFMSVFIPSGSLGLGGIQLSFYFIFLIKSDFHFMELSLIYQVFLFLPAIFLSLILLLVKKHKEFRAMGKIEYNFIAFIQLLISLVRNKVSKMMHACLLYVSNAFKYFRVKDNL